MSNSILTTIAWGVVDGASGIADNSRGIATSARTSDGSYTLTMEEGFLLDNNEMMLTVIPTSSVRFTVQLGQGSDSVKIIQTYNALGVLADVDFYYKLEKLNLL